MRSSREKLRALRLTGVEPAQIELRHRAVGFAGRHSPVEYRSAKFKAASHPPSPSFTATPWKNGGGITHEARASPPAAIHSAFG